MYILPIRKLRIMVLTLALISALIFLLPPTFTNKEEPLPQPQLAVSFSKTEIFPGDYFVIYVDNLKTTDEINILTELVGKTPPLISYRNGKIAVFAVNYRTKPGQYPLVLTINRNGQTIFEKKEEIVIAPKDFQTQYLQVTASQQATRTDALAQQDAVHVNKAKSVSSDTPLWEGLFIMPIEGRISTEYGLVRYINKVESGRHAGLDIAASRGTPVKAANSGIVNLSRLLNVTGNTVIIDHGMNFFSAYCHMDVLLVKDGDSVKKGDIIGKVGSTGFSTGPHLHWTISSGALFINPWLFLEEDPLGWI